MLGFRPSAELACLRMQAIADLRMGDRLARMTEALCADIVDILGDGQAGEFP